jgi:hypothetical protein
MSGGAKLHRVTLKKNLELRQERIFGARIIADYPAILPAKFIKLLTRPDAAIPNAAILTIGECWRYANGVC